MHDPKGQALCDGGHWIENFLFAIFLAFTRDIIGLHFTFIQIQEKVKNQLTLMYSTSTKTAPADHQNIAPYPA